uniref:Uncharacterized protein n=1 Tax=Dinoroseobacter phage vB_DshS_R26L TaxID=3161158 RepID=A0AAU7VGS5_9CAUD
MAEMQIELELGPMMRRALITGLADMIDALPQYRFAVILELLKRDAISRTMIAEALGEAAIREHKADEEDQKTYDANKGEGCEPPDEKSWDEIMLEVLAELRDTPGGRAEVTDDGAE